MYEVAFWETDISNSSPDIHRASTAHPHHGWWLAAQAQPITTLVGRAEMLGVDGGVREISRRGAPQEAILGCCSWNS
jgi:hypothetical protein